MCEKLINKEFEPYFVGLLFFGELEKLFGHKEWEYLYPKK